jgi:serine/threonine-protein kinase
VPSPSDSSPPASRFGFEWDNFRYDFERSVVVHPDYEMLHLATRTFSLPGYPDLKGEPRLVELKPFLLPYGRATVERCTEQVRRAMCVKHPGIAQVFGAVFDGDKHPYLHLEHLRGCYLLTLLEIAVSLGRKLSPAFAAYVAAELADGLDYVHRRRDEEGLHLSLVHRAVGPMRVRVGVGGRVQLTHLGVLYAELLGRLHTAPEVLRGDLAYLAPELMRSLFHGGAGQDDALTPPGLDGRADVFSLGLVLLEMLLARHPLEAAHRLWVDVEARFPASAQPGAPLLVELGTLANRVLHFGPEELLHAAHAVPEPLQRIVSKALRANPDERYSSASDMHNDLCCYLLGLKPAYGAKEVAEEASEILMHAAELEGVPAHAAFKQGLLPPAPGAGPESLN